MVKMTLRQIREKRLMSLKEVSAESGIPIKTIERWERDCRKANLLKLTRLLAMYRVSFDSIYIGHEDDYESQQLTAQFDVLCSQVVRTGQIAAFFRTVMDFIQSYSDFEDFAPSQQEDIRKNVIELVNRRLVIAIRKHVRHDGQPMEPHGVYHIETNEHFIRVRCSCCNRIWDYSLVEGESK